jgi:NADH dehydrogenase
VIVGAGFAGYNAVRQLSKLAGASIEITVINSTDYFLYLPLLPQVGAGLVEPRHICVSLLSRMPNVRFVLGTVTDVDARQKVVTWASPEGGSGQAGYDRIILTAGSVNKLLPIPGVADHAHGFRSIAEAIYLRDHITRQLELAAGAADEAERRARCTFVVVGAGYTGTEVAAQGQLLTTRLAKRMPGLAGQQIRWMLLDTAPRLLPELHEHLSKTAGRVLRRRGVEVRTGQSVATALDGCWVQLSTGEKVATHSLIWCVGVRADPLVSGLDLDTDRGRLVVDEFMAVPSAPDIYACGDCAAVPDLTRPGEICGMTAQHAQRQGKQVARNVAASLGAGKAKPYKHHDLGFVVDLGGLAAAANPLKIPLSGLPANVVTRAYHLIAMAGNRARVLAEWGLNVIVPAEVTSFGVIGPGSVPLDPDQPRSLPGIASAAPHRCAPRTGRRTAVDHGVFRSTRIVSGLMSSAGSGKRGNRHARQRHKRSPPDTAAPLPDKIPLAEARAGGRFGHDKPTVDNSIVLLIDHQVGLLASTRDTSSAAELKSNIVGLGRVAKALGLPTMIASSNAQWQNGDILPEIKELFPGTPIIRRTGIINAYEDPTFRTAFEKIVAETRSPDSSRQMVLLQPTAWDRKERRPPASRTPCPTVTTIASGFCPCLQAR